MRDAFISRSALEGYWNRIVSCYVVFVGRDSSVGPGIEKNSRWGRDFSQMSRPALGPTQSPVQRVTGLSRG
jgi:hypothetical protein